MNVNHAGARKRLQPFDYLNILIMVILCVIFIYPLLMTIGLSFSDAKAMVGQTVYLFPIGFSLTSYQAILSDISILRYYFNTILYAFSGTFLVLLVTSLMAYPLTIPGFRGRKFVMVLLMITMFFGGGLIPTYLTIRRYHMLDTLWVMIIPGCISAWNVIMFQNFFKTIPDSLRESATIDGAGHFRVLFSIILPLSKPLLATIALFTIVGFWNDYFNALIYLDTTAKMPIQMFLRRILVTVEFTSNSSSGQDLGRLLELSNTNPRTVKAAATIVTIVPILCVYPFLQKYFTKGLMLGAVKA